MLDILIQLIILILAVLAAGAKSVQFAPNGLTEFELQRRLAQKDKAALQQHDLRKNQHLLIALQRLVGVLLIALIVVILIASYPLVLALVFVVLWLVIIELLAAVRRLDALFNTCAQRCLPILVKVVGGLKPALRFFAPGAPHGHMGGRFFSKEELIEQLAADKTLLTPEEKRLLLYALQRDGLRIKDVMIPRAAIITIDKGETLGPLLLDRLHRVGRMFLPVIDRDLAHIVGVLNVHTLMPLNPALKQVSEAMSQHLYYLAEGQPLDALITAFLHTGQHLFIVVNESEETAGVITIEDALQRIVGSAPAANVEYEDPRAVARLCVTRARSESTGTHQHHKGTSHANIN